MKMMLRQVWHCLANDLQDASPHAQPYMFDTCHSGPKSTLLVWMLYMIE